MALWDSRPNQIFSAFSAAVLRALCLLKLFSSNSSQQEARLQAGQTNKTLDLNVIPPIVVSMLIAHMTPLRALRRAAAGSPPGGCARHACESPYPDFAPLFVYPGDSAHPGQHEPEALSQLAMTPLIERPESLPQHLLSSHSNPPVRIRFSIQFSVYSTHQSSAPQSAAWRRSITSHTLRLNCIAVSSTTTFNLEATE